MQHEKNSNLLRHRTNREKEIERVNSIGRGNIQASNISRININFINDQQMSSSGTKLIGIPSKEEAKLAANKNGVSNNGAKKTLISTNSTSLLDTMVNQNTNSSLNTSFNKGNQFLPNFRQKQHRDAAIIS